MFYFSHSILFLGTSMFLSKSSTPPVSGACYSPSLPLLWLLRPQPTWFQEVPPPLSVPTCGENDLFGAKLRSPLFSAGKCLKPARHCGNFCPTLGVSQRGFLPFWLPVAAVLFLRLLCWPLCRVIHGTRVGVAPFYIWINWGQEIIATDLILYIGFAKKFVKNVMEKSEQTFWPIQYLLST